MPLIKRRHFLQAAGATLASIGLSQLDFLHQVEGYGQVLAQGSPSRKLALLVGINTYPDKITSLQGCLTDVELQWELLVHRFGFNPKDILVVADRTLPVTPYEPLKPTRDNILNAFKTHLLEQAKPGDVVVFHYSGHGSRILDPSPIPELIINNEKVPNTDKLNGTMVPYDRLTSDPAVVQDIMGRTLFLLMRSLKTELVTAVLDSCHSGGGIRGGLTFRAVSSRVDGDNPDGMLRDRYASPSPVELELQHRLMKDLNISETQLADLRKQGIAKGVAIGSAQFDQSAADAPFDNETFHAGAFTYLLTRYLWQSDTNESLKDAFVNLARSTKDLAANSKVEQFPIFAANPTSNAQKWTYFLSPPQPWAEAVVRDVKPDGRVEYWLGGVSSLSLAASDKGGLWAVIDAQGNEIAELEQTSRTGLMATGTLRSGQLNTLQTGTLLREKIRGVPTDLKLRVSLDGSLGNQLQLAAAALQKLKRVQIVSTEQGADCILGRMTPALRQQVTRGQTQQDIELPKAETVGLFLTGLRPIAPTFNDKPGESAQAAVERLEGRFKSLLAGKLLKLVTGSDAALVGQSSAYKVAVAIAPKGSIATTTPKTFKQGTTVQVQVRNNEKRNLYIAVIGIGESGKITPLYPYWNSAENEALLGEGQVLLTPVEGDGYNFTLTGAGSFEVLVLVSEKPIRDALKGLQTIAAGRSVEAGSRTPLLLSGEEELGFVEALISDGDRNTRGGIQVTQDIKAIDRRQLAAISTILEVVK
ncbi:caspase family protein [Allocoleopsis sp.]|uniref:caspase family protein n=1 Tax=Allocoleopsis sp. TaxID=3088169 RepID=UPI002FD15BA3